VAAVTLGDSSGRGGGVASMETTGRCVGDLRRTATRQALLSDFERRQRQSRWRTRRRGCCLQQIAAGVAGCLPRLLRQPGLVVRVRGGGGVPVDPGDWLDHLRAAAVETSPVRNDISQLPGCGNPS
jgi:hypothetical protein